MFTSTDLATGVQCHPSVQSHPARRYPKRTGLSPKWDPNRTWRNKKRTPNHKIPTRKVRKNSKYLPKKMISRKKSKMPPEQNRFFQNPYPNSENMGQKRTRTDREALKTGPEKSAHPRVSYVLKTLPGVCIISSFYMAKKPGSYIMHAKFPESSGTMKKMRLRDGTVMFK